MQLLSRELSQLSISQSVLYQDTAFTGAEKVEARIIMPLAKTG
jgi:hypothetical protein